jgi:hypothetical protein
MRIKKEQTLSLPIRKNRHCTCVSKKNKHCACVSERTDTAPAYQKEQTLRLRIKKGQILRLRIKKNRYCACVSKITDTAPAYESALLLFFLSRSDFSFFFLLVLFLHVILSRVSTCSSLHASLSVSALSFFVRQHMLLVG